MEEPRKKKRLMTGGFSLSLKHLPMKCFRPGLQLFWSGLLGEHAYFIISISQVKIWLRTRSHFACRHYQANRKSHQREAKQYQETNLVSVFARVWKHILYSASLGMICYCICLFQRHFGDFKYPLDCRGSRNVSYSNANSTLCPPRAIIQQRKVISCSKDKNACRDKPLK